MLMTAEEATDACATLGCLTTSIRSIMSGVMVSTMDMPPRGPPCTASPLIRNVGAPPPRKRMPEAPFPPRGPGPPGNWKPAARRKASITVWSPYWSISSRVMMVLGTALISSSFGFCGSADALNDSVGSTCAVCSAGDEAGAVVDSTSFAKTEEVRLSKAELSTVSFP